MTVESGNGSLSALPEEHLAATVECSLQRTGYVQHRSLTVQVHRGVVIVEGVLPSWFMRQVALECVKRVVCGAEVVDRIQVLSEPQYSAQPQLQSLRHAVFSQPVTAEGLTEEKMLN